jgi:hypothetical protein
MNVELLIHAIVRQTTVLIAQLATSHGIRAPLAQIADQVFADLVGELSRQGVSRKVSADMFGLGLRTYRRKVRRLRESSTMRGRSLWETAFGFIKESGVASRTQIVTRFLNDDEAQVKSVLRDLCESRLIVASGSGPQATYRAAAVEETKGPGRTSGNELGDDLLVALMYREGPLTSKEVAAMAQEEPPKVEARLARLVDDGRIQRDQAGGEPKYRAEALVIPLGAEAGWEGAVFDHFKALVGTVMSRLRDNQPAAVEDYVGGSTYTIEVWDGHPLEEEVLGTLRRSRAAFSDMRARVAEHRKTVEERPRRRKRVIVYIGQSVIEEEDENGD